MSDYYIALEKFLTSVSEGTITISEAQEDATILASHLHQYDITENPNFQDSLPHLQAD